MVTLIALISSGKGTWGQVLSVINSYKWDNIYLICNNFSYDNFKIDPNLAIKLKFDEKNLIKSFNKISDFFKKNIKDFEVAINLYSGNGMEHMILVSSILKSGLGIRFVYCENKELKEFKLLELDEIEEYVEF